MGGSWIELKAEDRAEPPDPQTTMIEMLAALRTQADDIEALRALLIRWPNDPTGVCRRAVANLDSVYEQATRLLAAGETLAQAMRAAGHFSAAYPDVGVRP